MKAGTAFSIGRFFCVRQGNWSDAAGFVPMAKTGNMSLDFICARIFGSRDWRRRPERL